MYCSLGIYKNNYIEITNNYFEISNRTTLLKKSYLNTYLSINKRK